jgi:hypothetical protein
MRFFFVFLALIYSCKSSTIDPVLADRAGLSAEENIPPSVLMGRVRLDCAIDWKHDGRQELQLIEGAGLELIAVVSPIVDGTATLKGETKGGEYRFTSHLAKPAQGTLTGVGAVSIEKLETKVSVAIDGYEQRRGPGTPIAFRSEHMSKRGIYVEFAGVARAANGDRYSFRVNLGGPTKGEGEVTPSNANEETEIVAKMVMMEAPVVSSVQSLTRIEKIK